MFLFVVGFAEKPRGTSASLLERFVAEELNAICFSHGGNVSLISNSEGHSVSGRLLSWTTCTFVCLFVCLDHLMFVSGVFTSLASSHL